jgi:hypothetical protein
VDSGIPTFGCAVHINSWYVNLFSGQSSCENKPLSIWLIGKLLSLLWVKNCKFSHLKPFLWPTEFHWAVMFCFMAKPSALVVLCGLCSWTNIHGGHMWHSILKYNYCTAHANIVHKKSLDNKAGFDGGFNSNPAMYSAHPAVDFPNQPIFMRGDQAPHCAFLPVLVIFDILRKIFKWLSKNLQKPGALYWLTYFML